MFAVLQYILCPYLFVYGERVREKGQRKGTEPLHSSLHGLNLTNKHFIAVSCSGCQDLVASTPGTEPLSAGVVRDITVSI